MNKTNDETKNIGKTRRAYYLLSMFLIGLSTLFLIVLANTNVHKNRSGTLSATSLPTALSVMLLILGVILVIQTIRKKNDSSVNKSEWETTDGEEDHVSRFDRLGRSPIMFMVLSIFYVLGIEVLGFYLSSVVFLLAAFVLTGMLSWSKRIVIISVFLLFAYFVFAKLLIIRLPVGPFGF